MPVRPRRPIIRQIATSFDGSVVAVAEFEQHIQIWDVESRQRIAAFESMLDAGGRRLAISRDGKHCVAGAYNRYGIALYDAMDGREIWRRKDLKRVQEIHIALDGERVLCGFEDKSFEILNLTNGRSKPSFRGVKDVWESPYDPVLVFDRKNRDYKLATIEQKQIALLPRQTFAALAFAFAPQKFCLSESGGPIRCFDVAKGNQLWEYDPGSGVHALELAYNESMDEFAAITWPYRTGGDHQLTNLDAETGAPRMSYRLNAAPEFAFCSKGARLLASTGDLFATWDAELQGTLEFFPGEDVP